MSRIPDFEEQKTTEIKQQALSMDVAAQHYYDAYKRGMEEGKRQSLAHVVEAKDQLKKKASTLPGPVWHTAMQWVLSIEAKF